MNEQGHFTAEVRLVGISAIAMAIGACCALAALVLLRLIDLFTNLFYFQHLSLQPRSPADHALGWASVLVPMLGGLIVGLMARYGSERIRGHGIPEAMEAILIGRSRMSPKVAILKPVSSAIAIGSGGPFGAEGPIIMTGGSIGSIIAQAFHLTAAERKTLLVAGASGGMSAVFNTPMAAVLLAVEILLFEWKPRSLIPVALAAAVAALLRPYLLGSGAMFPVTPHGLLPTIDLLGAVPVGLLAGLLAMALTLAVYGAEDAFHRLPLHWMWWPVLGGLVVGLGGMVRAQGAGGGVRPDRGPAAGRVRRAGAARPDRRQGADLVDRAGLGDVGGRAGTALDDGMRPGGAGGERLAGGRSHLVAPGEHGRRARGDDAPALDQRDLRPGADPRPQRPAGPVDRLGGLVRPQRPGAEALDPDREGRPARVSHHPGVRGRSPGAAERRRGDDDRGGGRAGRATRPRPPQPVLLRRRRRSKHSGYPVVDKLGNLLGVITRSDLLEHWITGLIDGSKDADVLGNGAIIAYDLISRQSITAYPSESCRIAAERMAQMGVKQLPVVSPDDPNQLIGIVTVGDLLKAHQRLFEEEAKRERFYGRGLIRPRPRVE